MEAKVFLPEDMVRSAFQGMKLQASSHRMKGIALVAVVRSDYTTVIPAEDVNIHLKLFGLDESSINLEVLLKAKRSLEMAMRGSKNTLGGVLWSGKEYAIWCWFAGTEATYNQEIASIGVQYARSHIGFAAVR